MRDLIVKELMVRARRLVKAVDALEGTTIEYSLAVELARANNEVRRILAEILENRGMS